MVLVEKWPFFQLFFFQAIQTRKMSFTIFQNKKIPFQGIKTRSSKSRKIDIFSKGANPWFWSKNGHFSNSFFLGNIGQKNVFFRYSRTKKLPFQAMKTRSSNSRKIDIFPNRLSHGFGPEMAIFPTFFFRRYRPEKCLLPYSRTKLNAFLGYKKKEVQKV